MYDEIIPEQRDFFVKINARCDIAQYRLLKECSDKEDMTPWNEWRIKNYGEHVFLQGANLSLFFLKGARFHNAHCEGADFCKAHCEEANFRLAYCKKANFWKARCEGADFWRADCERTNFSYAHCEGTDFWRADCERTNFSYAHCEGTDFSDAHCQGTQFISTIFSGSTIFTGCEISETTNCSNSSLASVVIESGKRAKLEQITRQKNWKRWCNDLLALPVSDWITRTGSEWIAHFFFPLKAIMAFFVKGFWWLSDYGYSTIRVLLFFLLFVIGFACVYTLYPGMLAINGGKPLVNPSFWQMLAFSASTMVTLGFSNINVAIDQTNIPSGVGMLVVTANLMVGYFMLAVLVTRLAILFQTQGPGMRLPKEQPKDAKIEEDEEN